MSIFISDTSVCTTNEHARILHYALLFIHGDDSNLWRHFCVTVQRHGAWSVLRTCSSHPWNAEPQLVSVCNLPSQQSLSLSLSLHFSPQKKHINLCKHIIKSTNLNNVNSIINHHKLHETRSPDLGRQIHTFSSCVGVDGFALGLGSSDGETLVMC